MARFNRTILLFWATISSVSAHESVDTKSVVDIENVTIVASKRSSETIPSQLLSGEELERLSAHSIADAARYFSGVQIKDYGGVGGLKTINVRSMGSQHVGVFYDGIELGNAQNGVVDLGRFSLDNIESLSIYNGQKSAIFQSAKDFASSSSIYMTTRRPRFEQNKGYNLNLGVKGGSFKTINPSALWEQRLSNRVSSSISGEYLYSSGEYPFTYSKADGYDTTMMRQNGDIRYLRGEVALFGDIKDGEWQAKSYLYDSERGYPGAVVREGSAEVVNEDRQWDRNIFVQGSLRKALGRLYSLKVSAKYANDYLRYISDYTTSSSIDNHYEQQEAYASIANLFDICSWATLSLASDIQYNTLDADLSDFAYPTRWQSFTSLAGAIDYNGFRAQGSILYTYVNDETEVGAEADDLSEFTPTLIASYRPLKGRDLTLRALYKRVFRMPTFNDLYYTEFGNSDLDPEFTTQYNIGATYRLIRESSSLKEFEIQGDIYYNEVENKIVAIPTSNQFRWTMMNLGYVEIRGVDASIDALWALGSVDLSTRLNYSYQRAEDFTDPNSDYYGDQIPYAPWHSGSAIVGLDHKGWSLNYSFLYTGERYEQKANIAENYTQPWYTSDLSLSKMVPLRGYALRLTAEVNNLFNQQYEVVQCYPMPGINYRLKLNVTL